MAELYEMQILRGLLDQQGMPDQQEIPDQQAFFSTPAGRAMKARQNGFQQRLTDARGAVTNVLLRDDDLYQADNRRDLVDFLMAIAVEVEPRLEDRGSGRITKRRELFEDMVPTMDPVVFKVVLCMFLIYPFERVFETLLLAVFKDSQAVYYIDMAGRKYTGMDQFEKHNKFFYGTMCYGERVAKVNLPRLVMFFLDFVACQIFIILTIVGIYHYSRPANPLLGLGMGLINIYMLIRNVQEFYEQRQFRGYDRSNEKFSTLIQISIHLITYTLFSIPIASEFEDFRYRNQEMGIVFVSNFASMPFWIYHQLGWYHESFWSIPMVP